MITRPFTVALLISGAAFLCADQAFANGINPPRVRDAEVVRASCVERTGARRHEILRARITVSDKSLDRLTFRIGDASEQLALASIKSMDLASATVDRNGYLPVKLVRRDESREDSAAVQVRLDETMLRLSGFDASGSSLSIEIGKCRTIEFANGAQDAQPNAKPRPKA